MTAMSDQPRHWSGNPPPVPTFLQRWRAALIYISVCATALITMLLMGY